MNTIFGLDAETIINSHRRQGAGNRQGGEGEEGRDKEWRGAGGRVEKERGAGGRYGGDITEKEIKTVKFQITINLRN